MERLSARFAPSCCPVFPGRARHSHVGFDDPPRLARGAHSEEEALEHYREVRDEILRYVQALPEVLGESGGPERDDEQRGQRPGDRLACRVDVPGTIPGNR